MVGEEIKEGEDETMKCHPVPTRSPAAALMETAASFSAACTASAWDGLGLCNLAWMKRGAMGAKGRGNDGTAEMRGYAVLDGYVRALPQGAGVWQLP